MSTINLQTISDIALDFITKSKRMCVSLIGDKDMQPFNPTGVRYIKLGAGGAWAAEAIDAGIITFGFHAVAHEPCARGAWEEVRRGLIAAGRTPGVASQDIREIRDFYELPDSTLWVTIAHRHLYWCFADGPVQENPTKASGQPSRWRNTRDGWHRQSLTGEVLSVDNLTSALTRTANYRRTICMVAKADYLLRRIRGEADPLHDGATRLKAQMRELTLAMIRQLHWEEFETLVDLIFTRGGWRRTSLLGKDMPDVDLVIDQPITGETGWVQVKTSARQAELNHSLEQFEKAGTAARFFFVCHAPQGKLEMPGAENLHLWTGDALANLTIDVGLFDWLMARTR